MSELLRECRKCGSLAIRESDLDLFVKNKTCRYGYDNLCKVCFNEYYRRGNPGYKARRRAQRKYDSTERGRALHRKNSKIYALRYPERAKAHIIANNYPLDIACKLCGITNKLERHHPDYSKPSEFITLCRECHMEVHYY